MKRFAFLLAGVLAGCASAPDAAGPRRIAIRLDSPSPEGPAPVTLWGVLEGDAHLPSDAFADDLAEELRRQGKEVARIGPAESAESYDGVLRVTAASWDFRSMSTSGMATIEYTVELTTGGQASWSRRMPRRTIALLPDERRNPRAFIRRMAIGALRDFP